MKIFISFAGTNDLLTTNPEGGAILTICKDLKPDKAYIFYNIDTKGSNSDFFAAASQTQPELIKLSIDTREIVKDPETGKRVNNNNFGKPTCECELVKIICDDPTDYNTLFPLINHEVENIIEANGSKHEYYINITSGTPTMHLIWFLVHKKSHFNSTLLRSLEKRHQRHYEGKPYLEVNFNLDDFPEISSPTSIKRELTIKKRENDNLKEQVQKNDLSNSIKGFIGESKPILEIKEQILEEIDATTSVLILGERGTGKEVVANEIWRLYRKGKDKELNTQDCGSISPNLIESTLFGYEKGSHSEAKTDKKGLFESSNGEILFLDEIANLSVNSQKKMLRYLQFGTIKRVGGTKTIKINTQLIAATNKDVDDVEIFADDIKDRFDEIIKLPSLRDHKEDIPLLIDHFIRIECKKRLLQGLLIISDDLKDKIMDYNWPGNVRQLEKFISKLVRKFGARELSANDLPERFIDIIRVEESEHDFILPDLPINEGLDQYISDYKNAIIQKARSMTNKSVEVDRLLGQNAAERNRLARDRKSDK